MRATESEAAPAIDVGTALGEYEIVARLSSGGMASLYLARRKGAAGFSRHVAIKVVHPHLAKDQQFVNMFQDEAKLSARIHHPNVVHIEDLGEAEGTYYLAMEYVHGCSLAQMLAALSRMKRRLSPEIAVWIAMRLADGLHEAHETKDGQGNYLGVVHRDVSPQNVLISVNGHVKLIDFGIAKARNRQYHTATGSLKGKLKYMAPEQAKGSKVDRRTDIYALGIVLWEMLAMRRMFRAENDFELLEKVRNPEVVPPSRYAPEINPELDTAVLKALARDAEDRPRTALQFLRMLTKALPQAAAVDASRVAELMHAVLGEEIDRKTRSLPHSVTGLHHPGKGLEAEGRDETTAAPLSKRRSEVIEAYTVIETPRVSEESAELDDQANTREAVDDDTLPASPGALQGSESMEVIVDTTSEATRVEPRRSQPPLVAALRRGLWGRAGLVYALMAAGIVVLAAIAMFTTLALMEEQETPLPVRRAKEALRAPRPAAPAPEREPAAPALESTAPSTPSTLAAGATPSSAREAVKSSGDEPKGASARPASEVDRAASTSQTEAGKARSADQAKSRGERALRAKPAAGKASASSESGEERKPKRESGGSISRDVPIFDDEQF